MTKLQLEEYAEEYFDNPEEVLQEILQELIDEKGWSQDTTLKEAIQTHSKQLEKKLKNYVENY